jgi:hypothetical protein
VRRSDAESDLSDSLDPAVCNARISLDDEIAASSIERPFQTDSWKHMCDLSIEKITLEVSGVQWVCKYGAVGCLLTARTDVREPEVLGRSGARSGTDCFRRGSEGRRKLPSWMSERDRG